MFDFARRSPEERSDFFQETANRRGLSRLIVEKDFWVSFTLGIIFDDPELSRRLVFKGGTSLLKAFGIIKRFSEDVDLSVDPAWLGFVGATDPDDPGISRSERERRCRRLEAACFTATQERIQPLVEQRIAEVLGKPADLNGHLVFQEDAQTRSPILLFRYPTAERDERSYIKPYIKLEFGSLTDQRPVDDHQVTSWVAEEFPKQFAHPRVPVTALEAERTFWEKATILHAEYHRPLDRPMRARHSRDCYDLCALADHPSGKAAVRDRKLMGRVVAFKERYFRSGWTRFETARVGTFRIVPQEARLTSLRVDYREMGPMFFEPPPTFDDLLDKLQTIEAAINSEE